MCTHPGEPDPDISRQRQVLDDLFLATYTELRRLARAVGRSGGDVTLNTTALVNDAWCKLARSPHMAVTSRAHFTRLAARAMRQVLVEAARRRRAIKRDAGIFIAFDETVHSAGSAEPDVLGLDEVLQELEVLQGCQSAIVECRFFGGLSVSETAKALDISESTVNREWRVARAWLQHRLNQRT